MTNNFCIYKHISPNGKIYIGQTSQKINKRWRHDGTGYKKQKYFYNAILKYGWDNFEHTIIADNLTQSEANWLEKYLIRFYQSDTRECGYNLCEGGSTCKGVHRSEEFKSHLSKINKGKKLSEEHRRKISESQKGKKISKEQREFLSKINKGKKLHKEHIEKLRYVAKTRKRTPEEIEKSASKRRGVPLSEGTKKKLSESHKGKPSWNKGKHLSDKHKIKLSNSTLNRKDVSKQVKCVETNIIYESACEAARQTGLCSSHISACRNGKRLTCGGFHWTYVDSPQPEPEPELNT